MFLLRSGSATAAVTEVHYTMGTYFTITIDGADDETTRAAMRSCFADARRVESVFSRFDSTSELSRVNADAAPATTVSADMAELISRALELRDATGGTFDVTIGSLTALWRESPTWPPAASFNDPRARIRLQGRTLVRTAPNPTLDFDGIAKGYAVDRCVALLRRAEIARALVNLGESSQYALGAPRGGDGWPIAVRGDRADATIGTIRLRDQALSASAVFGHSRTLAGRRIGHIIDPATGNPLRTNAVAVVVADNATDAEAFSKAALIWGARAHHQRATDASPVQGSGPPRSVQAILYIEDDHVSRWHGDAMRFVPAYRPIAAAAEPLS
ncbi:MAG TPA: FAD:protein FMN transferase [Candidatus Kryptonia bacterium]|nr:FAD:protein FMN transferase [Candidatus Kryptonia bacterium]